MSLAPKGDSCLCWVFLSSLEKDALTWLLQLKPSIISSYEQLFLAFIKNYSLLVEELKTTDSLFEVIGHAHETFKSYFTRFEYALMTIAKPD